MQTCGRRCARATASRSGCSSTGTATGSSATASDWEILSLCVLEELSAPDVGEILGIAPGAVRARLMRAKRRLSHTLDIDSLTVSSGETR
ncbi:RNA polymerase sigma factor [Cryobacterium sp. N21]|uniref:RNA polymerase sigma factor n=1 Tax=Cryobacterium sp. N21 TaxID=2048289 RepID=UPI000CE35FD8|nr:sigma factor-like helix-turn-helix DNA-binding protein [Cryobacterium sp. N21]